MPVAIRRLLLAALLVVLPMAPGLGARAVGAALEPGAEPSREYLIKAAFLYNFARFTEWPRAAFGPAETRLRLCVLGEDPFGGALAAIEGKQVHGRQIAATRLDSVEGVTDCQLLFVGASEASRLDAVLKAIGTAPVLTVAEIPAFARIGGIIALKTVDDRVRFEVNQPGADRAGLKLSAKLLGLADPAGGAATGGKLDAPAR